MKILIGGRKYTHDLVAGLTQPQLLKIPEGYKTNILWNIGHIVVTQQILHYTLSGLKPHISRTQLHYFRKESSPGEWKETPDISEIMSLLMELPLITESDYKEGKFVKFKPYTTSTGIVLSCIEDAFEFNLFHEGIHRGIIQCLVKFT